MLTDNEKAAKVNVEREWPVEGVHQKQNNDHHMAKKRMTHYMSLYKRRVIGSMVRYVTC